MATAPSTKTLAAFKEASKFFTLVGNRILVERLPDEEVKTSTGLILSGGSRSEVSASKPLICLVVAIGEGYTPVDGTEEKIPLDVKVGSVVMINEAGVNFFSTIPGFTAYSEMKLGLASEGDIQMRFANMEEFEAYKRALNGVLNNG